VTSVVNSIFKTVLVTCSIQFSQMLW